MDVRKAAQRAKAEGAAGMLIRCRDGISLDIIRKATAEGADGDEAPNLPTVLVDDTTMDVGASLQGFDNTGDGDEVDVMVLPPGGNGCRAVKGFVAPWTKPAELVVLRPVAAAATPMQRLQDAAKTVTTLRSMGVPIGTPAPPADAPAGEPKVKKWAPVHTSYLWGGQKINVNYGDRMPAPESAPKNNLTGKQAAAAARRVSILKKQGSDGSKRVSIQLTAEQEVAVVSEEPGFRAPSVYARGQLSTLDPLESESFVSSVDGDSFAVQVDDEPSVRRNSQRGAAGGGGAQPLLGTLGSDDDMGAINSLDPWSRTNSADSNRSSPFQQGSSRRNWGQVRGAMAMTKVKADRPNIAVAAEDLPEELQGFFMPPWVAVLVTVAMIPCALILSGVLNIGAVFAR